MEKIIYAGDRRDLKGFVVGRPDRFGHEWERNHMVCKDLAD